MFRERGRAADRGAHDSASWTPTGETRSHGSGIRALILSQPTDYGVAVCVRQLARAASADGHDVTVACPPDGPLVRWLREDGIEHLCLDLRREPGASDLKAILEVRRLARSFDVIHLHSSKAGAVGRIAVSTLKQRNRPKVIFTPHSWSWNVGGRMAAVYRLLERKLASATDVIVAVSDQEAQEGRAVIGDQVDRVVVIPNGVDLDRFAVGGEAAERQADKSLIVCVGRLSVQKGQDVAIRALASLDDQSARLRLVGEESQHGEKKRLEGLAESLGIADRIEWEGRVDDPAPHFRAADVVVAPSRWEGMSLVFLEAMACGAPLVVSDVAGSDVVGSAAVIVPRDDVNSLAAALDDLLADEPARRRLSNSAQAARSSISLSTTLARNLELWPHHSNATISGESATTVADDKAAPNPTPTVIDT